MRHARIQQYLLLHREDQLDSPQREAVAAHLATCPECQQLVERLGHVYGFYSPEHRTSVPAGLYSAVLRRWHGLPERSKAAGKGGDAKRQGFDLFPVGRSLAAAAMILAAVGLGFFLGFYPEEQNFASETLPSLKEVFYTDMLEVSSTHSYYQAVEDLYRQPGEAAR